jgi:hypothetical protein
VQAFVDRFPRLHLHVAVAGNAVVPVGSVLFPSSSTRSLGTWLFIVGQVGVLLGDLGQVFVRHERR